LDGLNENRIYMNNSRKFVGTELEQNMTLKGKGKVVPVLLFNRAPRHEGVLGSGGIASRIL
jgi:hypothetical protein